MGVARFTRGPGAKIRSPSVHLIVTAGLTRIYTVIKAVTMRLSGAEAKSLTLSQATLWLSIRGCTRSHQPAGSEYDNLSVSSFKLFDFTHEMTFNAGALKSALTVSVIEIRKPWYCPARGRRIEP